MATKSTHIAKESSRPNYEELAELVRHHIDSYNYLVEKGLEVMVENIRPVVVRNGSETIAISLSNPKVHEPMKEGGSGTKRGRLLPSECRQAKISYTGKFEADACIQINDKAVVRHKVTFGHLPVMIKSNLCSLRHANSPSKLVSFHEEAAEVGGYFILNGLERVVRCVILPKGNYPMSTLRSSFRDRREGYTEKAVIIRCVREYQSSLTDQSSLSIKLYYLRSGSARLGVWIQGREFLIPIGIVLKALVETNDREVYDILTRGYDENSDKEKEIGSQLVSERAKIILNEVRDMSLFTQDDCLRHIGGHFQPIMEDLEHETTMSAAHAFLSNYILIHLNNNEDKFNLLIFMLQKLFSFVDQTSLADNSDSLQNHEILLPGHLITIYLKEKLEDWLRKCKKVIQEDIMKKGDLKLSSEYDAKKIMEKVPSSAVGLAVENMLKTGRLVSQTGLDMQQRAGYTVQAERLNYLRFLSFFRAVHRGASFAGLRTTSVRKLLPESWGFLCPVHTPDGEPCGLLNHMTSSCRITSYYDSKGAIKDFFDIRKSIMNVLSSLGMSPALPKLFKASLPVALTVLLDGRIIGSISSSQVNRVVEYLRNLKVSAPSVIPEDLEVGFVPLSISGPYPGLFLFTSPSRFIRPVRNLSLPPENFSIELIGPFEQVFMEISCPDGGNGGRRTAIPATHEEIHPTGMLSVVANLTPWSDHNQSPRNMYQCQMAKQTMAFSLQALHYRADQKLYHLQTPQTPIVRTKAYVDYNIDEYPTGTNAIVAVLAYTGYDMEDAMILNKSSVDRGMCHGQIYQTETIDLCEEGKRAENAKKTFRRSTLDKSVQSIIDIDGLPYVGQIINPGEPFCSIYNEDTNAVRNLNRKGSDPVYVDYVAVDTKNKNLQKANIRFRHTRNPIIGDKFSSRHGQKGVCSQLWPDVDMPFSGNTGMRPDLIINPHAFPSRMTIAMLLESLAAKGGSLNGKFVDATPFGSTQDSNPESLVDDLGEMLRIKGFNYHGVEVLYSGVHGTELTCEIFIGPVYYQRLRHMVSDKFQVRSTGTVDQVTRQPIKGRKRGGGIRFGEMERDAMLAHGASYLLHDRLHTCSDYHVADVCSQCGSILTNSFLQAQKRVVRDIGGLPPTKAPEKVSCQACRSAKAMETVAMPYVFRYLATEFAAMNIRMTLHLNDGSAHQ